MCLFIARESQIKIVSRFCIGAANRYYNNYMKHLCARFQASIWNFCSQMWSKICINMVPNTTCFHLRMQVIIYYKFWACSENENKVEIELILSTFNGQYLKLKLTVKRMIIRRHCFKFIYLPVSRGKSHH